MSELPTGTVTFLFTDIEGSTRLLHELGDAYAVRDSEQFEVGRARGLQLSSDETLREALSVD
jgi:class 3 adenylate cyclase